MDQILHQGDATHLQSYTEFPPVMDLILCDPPFPIKEQQYEQIRKDSKNQLDPILTPSPEEYLTFWEACLQIWVSKLKPQGWFCFKADDYGSKWLFPLTSRYFTYLGDVIWDKKAIASGYYIRKRHEVICVYRPQKPKNTYFLHKPLHKSRATGWHGGSKGKAFESVLQIMREQTGQKGQKKAIFHINQTPIDVWQPFIEWMCPYHGSVLDPFMGSGSIGIACKHLDRHYYGIEIDPQYIDRAKTTLHTTRSQKITSFLGGFTHA